jgi:hypothetical protein
MNVYVPEAVDKCIPKYTLRCLLFTENHDQIDCTYLMAFRPFDVRHRIIDQFITSKFPVPTSESAKLFVSAALAKYPLIYTGLAWWTTWRILRVSIHKEDVCSSSEDNNIITFNKLVSGTEQKNSTSLLLPWMS